MAHTRTIPDRNGNHQSGSGYLFAAGLACPHGLMIEERGRVVYANPAYARLCGYEDAKDVLGVTARGLSIRPAPNGTSERKYDSLHFDFRDEGRRLRLHVVRDVTERHALETRLRESEKLEAIGRLVAGVSHDFNNILTAITLHTGLLQELRLDGTGRQVDEILQAANRGTDLVRQLLTFARQNAGSSQVVSLRETINTLRPVLNPLIGEDIELQTNLGDGDDSVRCDPAQLQQVLLNLVMNARDAMARGGQIRIRTSRTRVMGHRGAHRDLRAGEYVSLAVEDTGCGMNEEVRARVFEPFFSTKKPGVGTGLGMSMVYGIVKQAGGAVTVASVPGNGTRVSILLPHAVPEHCSTSPSLSTAPETGSETILLVEDDRSIRESLSELLLARGYRVVQARDGLHAVEIARAHRSRIDLVLSDVVMPRLNGIDAAVRVRRLHPEARVLFISGYPAKATPKPAAHGPVLSKPFSRAMLARKVRETLERPPASGSARAVAAARGAS